MGLQWITCPFKVLSTCMVDTVRYGKYMRSASLERECCVSGMSSANAGSVIEARDPSTIVAYAACNSHIPAVWYTRPQKSGKLNNMYTIPKENPCCPKDRRVSKAHNVILEGYSRRVSRHRRVS